MKSDKSSKPFALIVTALMLVFSDADCQVLESNASDTINLLELEPPPPPPPPPPPHDNGFINREVQPIFPDCDGGSAKEAADCTSERMIEHIYKNLIIPEGLSESDRDKMAIVQFVIDADGIVSDFKLAREHPCKECGAAALEAVKSLEQLNHWIPAKQFGRRTKILYTMPVKFNKS